MKEEFIKLLKDIDRPGMDKLLEFLEKSDFFTAPASTRFHGSRENGLVEHSLKVYEILYTISEKIESKCRPSFRAKQKPVDSSSY